jgi:hypothetical protein
MIVPPLPAHRMIRKRLAGHAVGAGSTSNRTHGPVTRRGDVLLPDVAYARVSAAQWAVPIPPLPKSHNHCAEPLFGHAPGVAVMIATISRVVAVVCRGNTDWDIPA